MEKLKNTIQKGSVRYMVFKEKSVWYAAALEFNIVVSANDPNLALLDLFEAINGYVKSFKKIKGARPFALNQKSDPEYEKMWSAVVASKGTPIKSPFQIYSYGLKDLSLA